MDQVDARAGICDGDGGSVWADGNGVEIFVEATFTQRLAG